MNLLNHKKVLIVGLGLIGGSYAAKLTKMGYEVGAISKEFSSIDYGLKHHYIAHGMCEVKKDYIQSFSFVIFALYPNVFVSWMQQYHHYFKEQTIITDVTGVKGKIVSTIQSLLPDSVEFIASHPMAGKEVYGIENSDENLFQGANFIITPTSKNTPEGIKACEALGKTLGFKNISVLSVKEHDEMIAFLSQLTHCIAVSLMTSKASSHLVDYTGDSFRDLTRIAKINEEMWSELFLLNKDQLVEQMNLFMNEFNRLKEAIMTEDLPTMKEMMKLSTRRRKYFDKGENDL